MTGYELGGEMAFPDPGVGGREGLTKREYFAGLIMAAITSSVLFGYDPPTMQDKARGVLVIADALLEELAEVQS